MDEMVEAVINATGENGAVGADVVTGVVRNFGVDRSIAVSAMWRACETGRIEYTTSAMLVPVVDRKL